MNENKKGPGGRPKADIDWDYVDSLLEAGCSGREISSTIGITPQTIYDRCLQDNKKEFSLYSQEKQAKGESLLRAHQYAKALGYTDKGDNTLLIWLGKTRLKQIDASQLAAAEAGKVNYNIVTDAKGLAAGIPAEKLSNSNNKGPESGDEEGGMGSSS
jgi:hypothetical protein